MNFTLTARLLMLSAALVSILISLFRLKRLLLIYTDGPALNRIDGKAQFDLPNRVHCRVQQKSILYQCSEPVYSSPRSSPPQKYYYFCFSGDREQWATRLLHYCMHACLRRCFCFCLDLCFCTRALSSILYLARGIEWRSSSARAIQ